MKFDKQGKPIVGYGQDRTILKRYNGNPIQQYGIRIISRKMNNQYWKFIFHIGEAQGSKLLELNILRKMGIFIKHPRVTMDTTDIHPESQTLSRYDQKQDESTVKVHLDRQKTVSPLGQLRTLRKTHNKGGNYTHLKTRVS